MQIFVNQALPQETAATQSTDSNGNTANSATTSSATITANDFLQLLVTEMQNQDPTTQTDPNEYIDQLVQVNSLEQLVQINQELGESSSTSGTGTGDSTSGDAGSSVAGNLVTGSSEKGNLSAGSSTNAATGAATRVVSALGRAAQTLAPNASRSPYESILAAMKSRAHAGQPSTSNPAR